MSAQEIIAELAKLKPEELRLVKEKLNRLNAESAIPQTGWGRALLEIAGTADDLPPDLAFQHDHYLYGTPKRGCSRSSPIPDSFLPSSIREINTIRRQRA